MSDQNQKAALALTALTSVRDVLDTLISQGQSGKLSTEQIASMLPTDTVVGDPNVHPDIAVANIVASNQTARSAEDRDISRQQAAIKLGTEILTVAKFVAPLGALLVG